MKEQYQVQLMIGWLMNRVRSYSAELWKTQGLPSIHTVYILGTSRMFFLNAINVLAQNIVKFY